MTHKCGKHLSECVCPEITETLRDLANSDVIYIGNIIEARYRDGLSKPSDFEGINIHHPYQRPVAPPYPKKRTVDE